MEAFQSLWGKLKVFEFLKKFPVFHRRFMPLLIKFMQVHNCQFRNTASLNQVGKDPEDRQVQPLT